MTTTNISESKTRTIYLDGDCYISSISDEKPNQSLCNKFKYAVVVKEKFNRLSIKFLRLEDFSIICKLYENDIHDCKRNFDIVSVKYYQEHRKKFLRIADEKMLLTNIDAINYAYIVYLISTTPMLYININENRFLKVTGILNEKVFTSYTEVILFEQHDGKLYDIVVFGIKDSEFKVNISNSLIKEYLANYSILCKEKDKLIEYYNSKNTNVDLVERFVNLRRLMFIIAFEHMREQVTF